MILCRPDPFALNWKGFQSTHTTIDGQWAGNGRAMGGRWVGDLFNLWTKLKVLSSHFVCGVNFKFQEALKLRTQLEILATIWS